MPKKYSLADYRSQASKAPFPFEVDEGKVIEISPPTAETTLDVTATTDLREQLRLIAGDKYEALMDAIGDEQGAILKPLLADITKHFGLGE